MRILDLAFKDLSQMFRDKRSSLFLIVMPIMFTFFMGFAYGSGQENSEDVDNRIPLALIDPEPESRLNKMFHARLDSSDSIRIVSLTITEGGYFIDATTGGFDPTHPDDPAQVVIPASSLARGDQPEGK